SAIEDLEFVRKYRKRSIQPLLLLSALQIKQGHYDDAIKNLQRAHSIDNQNNEVLFQLGSLYYRNKNEKYISYFNNLFSRYSQKKPEDTPAKYIKAFQLLARARYENDQYRKVIAVTSWLPERSLSYDMRLIAAYSHYNLEEYQKAINNFEKISLNTDDSLTLCRAYARAEFTNKAITLLRSLYYNPSVREKAIQDPLLKKLVNEIENEKNESTDTPTISENESDQPVNIREVPEVPLETVNPEEKDPGDSSEKKIDNGDENIPDVQNKQQSPE
ncbi:MAG: tetratricopeptide repeat protein, partial [Spirochaetota bacterium]